MVDYIIYFEQLNDQFNEFCKINNLPEKKLIRCNSTKHPLKSFNLYTEQTKLFNLIPIPGLRVKVGKPIKVAKRLVREKYRDERYELAEDIINIIESLRPEPPEDLNNEIK